jgi:hypothetical protein
MRLSGRNEVKIYEMKYFLLEISKKLLYLQAETAETGYLCT